MSALASLPGWLVEATVNGSVAILFIAVLRIPVRRCFGAQAAHLLWLIVLAQFCAALLPGTPLSWRAHRTPVENMPVASVAKNRMTISVEDAPSSERAAHASSATPQKGMPAWPLAMWISGAVAMLIVSLLRALRAGWLVRRSRKVNAAELEDALGGMEKARWEIRETDQLRSPALCGWWRAVVLLPLEWRTQFTPPELRCVLAHELGHIRRGDLWWSWVFLFLRAVYWFNPLVWLAVRLERADQEMACDEWVTARRGFPDAQTYGETLLKAARLLRKSGFAAPVHAMAESKANLAARIRLLARHRTPGRFALAGILIVIVVAMAVLGPPPGTAKAAPADALAPEPAASPSPAPAASPAPDRTSQVEIGATFVEISGVPASVRKTLAFALPRLEKSGTMMALASVFPDAEFQDVMKRLQDTKGVDGDFRLRTDLLSSPRVITRSGQRAVVEVIREFRYPSGFDASSKPVAPTEFEIRNTGVTCEVLPVVAPDGNIDLTITPSVVEFMGFIDYGAAHPARAQGTDAIDAMMRPRSAKATSDVINQPVFQTRRITTSLTVKSGQTVLLGGLTRQDTQILEDGPPRHRVKSTQKIERMLFIFVSVRLIEEKGIPAAAPSPAVSFTPQQSASDQPGFVTNPIAPTKGFADLRSDTNEITFSPRQPDPAAKPDAPQVKAPAPLPYGVPVPNKPGFVTSPYAPEKGYVDLRGFPRNTEVKDPYTSEIFLVP